MKANKFLSVAILSSVMLAGIADASSIGRSGGGSSSGGARSSSSSNASKSSSYSAPSKPAAAPAPAPAQTAKPGGIGGNTQGSSVGVRKSEVTAPVAQQVRPSTTPTPSTTPGYSNSAPSYGSAPSPGFSPGYSAPSPGIGAGGVFMSSLGGSFAGTFLGNALFGHGSHGGGSTTVINNGTPSAGSGSVSNGVVASGPSNGFDSGPGSSNFSQPKKEYTVWSFIADVFGFVIVVALLLGIAWLFYKGFQLVRNFINKERGVSTQPFNPTQQFWTIQKAFAAADVATLNSLLGPDIVDELTNGLTPSTVTLHNVSHEVRLTNNTEFSIWYTFEDAGQTVNQVWHYEKFGKDWKLNGIETV